MSLRKALLRLMLASLAVSAVGGALAVLTAGTDIVWRVVVTGLATAVSAGLLLPLSMLLDREKPRAAGLLGMGAVVFAFLLTLALIWQVSQFVTGGSRDEWPVALTLFAVFLAAPPAMLFLRLVYTETASVTGGVGVAACAAAFFAMALGSWFESSVYSEIGAKLWASAGIVGGFGIVAAVSLAGWGFQKRPWRWVGVAMSIIGCAIALIGLWREIHRGGVAILAVTGLAVLVAHANLALMCPLTTGQRWVRWITIAAVAATAILLAFSAYESENAGWDWTSRAAGAAGIVAACGSLALLVLARLNRRMSATTVPISIKELTIICPWCHKRQTVPLGESACAGCGLKITIRVEEPRCPHCDYLLYMLQSDRCPECGTPVAAKGAAVSA